MKKRILHLTLKKEWFDLILKRKKDVEYRDIKPYWTNRLLHKNSNPEITGWEKFIKKFDEIHFKNGYSKKAPFIRIEWKGMIITHDGDPFNAPSKYYYAIKLGEILETRNIK